MRRSAVQVHVPKHPRPLISPVLAPSYRVWTRVSFGRPIPVVALRLVPMAVSLRDNIHEGHFRMSRTSSQLRGEDSNPGTRKKAGVSHENFVRDRIYREGMGSIMGTYLV